VPLQHAAATHFVAECARIPAVAMYQMLAQAEIGGDFQIWRVLEPIYIVTEMELGGSLSVAILNAG